MFKFWPKNQLKNAWLRYVSGALDSENQNINAAFLSLSILENVTQVFVENFNKKQAQKAAKLGKDKDRMERFQASIKGGGATLIEPL